MFLSFDSLLFYFFFFFNDTATTEIYTLSLHDALPIYTQCSSYGMLNQTKSIMESLSLFTVKVITNSLKDCQKLTELRSEEHTSELQSQSNLVCRLLLEKKKKQKKNRSK